MKKHLLIAVFYSCTSAAAYCQSIGIGTVYPHSSAQVDISSSTKGILIPRMSTAGIASISIPEKGLMVYDSAKNQLMVNMGTATSPNWQTIIAKSGWNLNGNSGIDPANNFIGTTDNSPLAFKINNQSAGYLSTIGASNVFLGIQSGNNNPSGGANTGIGAEALYSNTSGAINTALGERSLYSNTSGQSNTAIGVNALDHNSTGELNTAIGASALSRNQNSYSTGIGAYCLTTTSFSQFNTAVGFHAANYYDMGYNNTIIGANCDVNSDGLYNCVALGQAVTCTANSQARIGNSATTSIGGYVGWSNLSDGRYKKNVQDNVKGIDFIMKLRPVTYQLDVQGISTKLNESRGMEVNTAMKQAISDKEKMIFSGFIAQDVESAAKEMGYDFSGVDAPKNAKDVYSLRYGDFVVPLTKAVQEQQLMITTQQDLIVRQKQLISDLQSRLQVLEEQMKTVLSRSTPKN